MSKAMETTTAETQGKGKRKMTTSRRAVRMSSPELGEDIKGQSQSFPPVEMETQESMMGSKSKIQKQDETSATFQHKGVQPAITYDVTPPSAAISLKPHPIVSEPDTTAVETTSKTHLNDSNRSMSTYGVQNDQEMIPENTYSMFPQSFNSRFASQYLGSDSENLPSNSPHTSYPIQYESLKPIQFDESPHRFIPYPAQQSGMAQQHEKQHQQLIGAEPDVQFFMPSSTPPYKSVKQSGMAQQHEKQHQQLIGAIPDVQFFMPSSTPPYKSVKQSEMIPQNEKQHQQLIGAEPDVQFFMPPLAPPSKSSATQSKMVPQPQMVPKLQLPSPFVTPGPYNQTSARYPLLCALLNRPKANLPTCTVTREGNTENPDLSEYINSRIPEVNYAQRESELFDMRNIPATQSKMVPQPQMVPKLQLPSPSVTPGPSDETSERYPLLCALLNHPKANLPTCTVTRECNTENPDLSEHINSRIPEVNYAQRESEPVDMRNIPETQSKMVYQPQMVPKLQLPSPSVTPGPSDETSARYPLLCALLNRPKANLPTCTVTREGNTENPDLSEYINSRIPEVNYAQRESELFDMRNIPATHSKMVPQPQMVPKLQLPSPSVTPGPSDETSERYPLLCALLNHPKANLPTCTVTRECNTENPDLSEHINSRIPEVNYAQRESEPVDMRNIPETQSKMVYQPQMVPKLQLSSPFSTPGPYDETSARYPLLCALLNRPKANLPTCTVTREGNTENTDLSEYINSHIPKVNYAQRESDIVDMRNIPSCSHTSFGNVNPMPNHNRVVPQEMQPEMKMSHNFMTTQQQEHSMIYGAQNEPKGNNHCFNSLDDDNEAFAVGNSQINAGQDLACSNDGQTNPKPFPMQTAATELKEYSHDNLDLFGNRENYDAFCAALRGRNLPVSNAQRNTNQGHKQSITRPQSWRKQRLFTCMNPDCPESFDDAEECLAHEFTCLYQRSLCLLKGCPWTGRFFELAAHIRESHVHCLKNSEKADHKILIPILLNKCTEYLFQSAHQRLFVIEVFLRGEYIHIACQWIPEWNMPKGEEVPYCLIQVDKIPDEKLPIWRGPLLKYPSIFFYPNEQIFKLRPVMSLPIPWSYQKMLNELVIQVQLQMVPKTYM